MDGTVPASNREIRMTNTYRAAFIAADADSTGGGIVLTTEEQAGLPDAELLAAARVVAEEVGAEGEIVIGDWRE
ncbi:hypothetical protein SAMN05216359_105250 [Roseateles sp. YR242]|uniref:hypothetical protein n=1 Tax=Roseateles sp. YR242 TaxID=1855305 RepID=UPI0008D50DD1|nr:hypothetical protein [Roseateles sp. YR242]SEL11566.1 hypothetical protein SAMN05216359_105250 [Roseateles sp. YR242]